MTTLRAKITAWQQVTIRNKETGEMVTLIPTDASKKRIYGLPINRHDGRVVFPRSIWKVVE